MTSLGHFGMAVDVDAEGQFDAAGEIESMGYGSLWIHGGQLERIDQLAELVAETRAAIVAPAVVLADAVDAGELRDLYRRVEAASPGRLTIGLGVPAGADATAVDYLDRLRDNGSGIPRDRILLAAMGPRRLRLAREQVGGAVPMLFTTDYTATARHVLGEGRLLALGQYVVIDDDPVTARASARVPLAFLFSMPAYVKSALRQGFTDDDVETLSDRLVDAFVAWGTTAQVAERLHEQRAAGADHVYVSALTDGDQPGPAEAAELLAPYLVAG